MDIPSLIQLLQNKVSILSNARSLAFSSGDLDRMNNIDKELLGTQNTLSQLQLLLIATQTANASNLDLSSVVNAGVVAAQNAMSIPDDPTAVLSQYDISTYAADPAYIQKITDMLTQMPVLDNSSEIDAYISNEVIGSPITGQMVMDATTKYAVDTRLTMAIMELDSRFGTAGTGSQTFNPGNVGNTGTTITTFASWSDGVAAVAYWLSTHRIGGPTPIAVVPDTTATDATTTASTILPIDSSTATSTTATSTASVATSTPPVVIPPIVLPPVPVTTVSTTTSPVTVTVTASSTDAVGTTTLTTTTTTASSTDATSTQSFNLNDPTASSTDATSTLNIPPFTSTSTSATSTNATTTGVTSSNGTTTPSTATTTPSLDLGNIGNATSTTATSSNPVISPATSTSTVIPSSASTTPDTTASTTQARRSSKRKVA